MATISGVIKNFIFKNDENSFHICSVEVDSGDTHAVTISQPSLHEGISYEFKGEWNTHSKFGKQFKATSADEILPHSLEGLKKYLQSGLFPGIGKVIAGKIIGYFGKDALDVFMKTPDRLMEVHGISKKKLKAIKEAWEKNKEINSLMMFLRSYNLSTLLCDRIYKFYGHDCVRKIKENPYKLIYDIDGIGFETADRMAIGIGYDVYSPERLKAGLTYTIDKSSRQQGHCYLTEEQLLEETKKILILGSNDEIKKEIEVLIDNSHIKKVELSENEIGYYSRTLYYAETYCAEKIHLLKNYKVDIKTKSEWLESIGEFQLSDEQKKAVKGIVENKVSVLTGAAGVGKSTVVKKIIEILVEKLGKNVMLVAPTGRAAQRLIEVTGFSASTIHRALGWDFANKCFKHNENNGLDVDFLLVDESSMLGIDIASDLLKAIPNDAQICFIGDYFQLPSISPGTFFEDIIHSEVLPVFRLTQIFRQAAKSMIIKHAHEINNGIVPDIANPMLDPELFTNKVDCLFINSGLRNGNQNKNDYPKDSSLRYNMDIREMLVKLYTEIIPKYYGNDKEIQVLSPMNISELGNIKLNEILQAAINPKSPEKPEMFINGKTFRVNDRIIHIRNNYETTNRKNGEIGKITAINPSESKIFVKFMDGQITEYIKDDLLDLNHAYSISIHKSQGSEFNCVIILVMEHFSRMLKRKLLYTALTRGKDLTIVIGQKSALSDGVNNLNIEHRQTYLKERLREEKYVMPI